VFDGHGIRETAFERSRATGRTKLSRLAETWSECSQGVIGDSRCRKKKDLHGARSAHERREPGCRLVTRHAVRTSNLICELRRISERCIWPPRSRAGSGATRFHTRFCWGEAASASTSTGPQSFRNNSDTGPPLRSLRMAPTLLRTSSQRALPPCWDGSRLRRRGSGAMRLAGDNSDSLQSDVADTGTRIAVRRSRGKEQG